MSAQLEHGAFPLFLLADYCEHPLPEQDGPELAGWEGNHQYGPDGDRLCLVSPAGEYCPACTQRALEFEDLPMEEFVTCRIASPEVTP